MTCSCTDSKLFSLPRRESYGVLNLLGGDKQRNPPPERLGFMVSRGGWAWGEVGGSGVGGCQNLPDRRVGGCSSFLSAAFKRSDVVLRRVFRSASEVMFQSGWRSQSRFSAEFGVAPPGFKFGATAIK